jgi:hypothetical protein
MNGATVFLLRFSLFISSTPFARSGRRSGTHLDLGAAMIEQASIIDRRHFT